MPTTMQLHTTGGTGNVDALMIMPEVATLLTDGGGHFTGLLTSKSGSTEHRAVALGGTGSARVSSYDRLGRLVSKQSTRRVRTRWSPSRPEASPSSPAEAESAAGSRAAVNGTRSGAGSGGRIMPPIPVDTMIIARSILLFIVAALAEIGGAWLIWQGVREHRGLLFVGAGVIALGLYGFVATLQPDANFGRILAAYGGVFVAGSLAWGAVVDKFRPDRWDLIGAAICLAAKRIPSSVTLMSVIAGRPSGQLLFDHADIVTLAVEKLRLWYGRELDPAPLDDTFTVLQPGSTRRSSIARWSRTPSRYVQPTPSSRRQIGGRQSRRSDAPRSAWASSSPGPLTTVSTIVLLFPCARAT